MNEFDAYLRDFDKSIRLDDNQVLAGCVGMLPTALVALAINNVADSIKQLSSTISMKSFR